MSNNVMVVYKSSGQTPLEAIDELKKTRPELSNVPLTYAGRLDPLASGVLLILAGDECLKKDEYLALEKEYELTVLFGFSTDTYDLMGKVEEINSDDLSADITENVKDTLGNFIGRISQKYPPYSSRTVLGKPLYQWAREGRIGEITIPSHDVYVKSIDMIGNGKINGQDLGNKIKEIIAPVKGDFRQNEILDLWAVTLKDKDDMSYQKITLKIACGSGVYVRGIAHELGKQIGVPALAMSIVRTKVGEYIL